MKPALRVGIVAGELSGDILGAGLIHSLRKLADYSGQAIEFEGIAGPQMQSAGCQALFDSDELAVMGLFEVLKHLPRIFAIRKALTRHFVKHPPDVFIGIDAPDFNLGLERKLRQRGIKTVHYVSPTVWAWREKRMKKIARSVDLMLSLFPFEAEYYKKQGVPVVFVGHHLADSISELESPEPARKQLALAEKTPIVAVLPGSRGSEMNKLASPFLDVIEWCHMRQPDIQFVVPLAKPSLGDHWRQAQATRSADLPITVVEGRSREVMAAADVVLLASGTATLEAALLKKPMIVAYKVSPLTHFILKRMGMLKIDTVALPNLLVAKPIVREFLQDDVQAEAIGTHLLELLGNDALRRQIKTVFSDIHNMLRKNASEQAAAAVWRLIH